MRILLIAIGNPLRRDDGAAARILEMFGQQPGVEVRAVFQPTPELAAEFEGMSLAVFVDADAAGQTVRLERLTDDPFPTAALGHAVTMKEVLLLARRLFHFDGECFLCRIPGYDFGLGEGLSEACASKLHEGVRLLREIVSHARRS